MFQLSADSLHWVTGDLDDPEDLCAHGHAVARIGDEVLEYDATVSAAALYLLRTLTEDWVMIPPTRLDRPGFPPVEMSGGERLFPCCGFNMFVNTRTPDMVDILGCGQGVDWTVLHQGDQVKLITPSGKETIVPLADYRREVFAFADEVEDFYRRCSPKIPPRENYDREGYAAFWREWRRRRGDGTQNEASGADG